MAIVKHKVNIDKLIEDVKDIAINSTDFYRSTETDIGILASAVYVLLQQLKGVTMSDLIKREDAIAEICKARTSDVVSHQYAELFINAVRRAPSADRPQGWIPCRERLPNEKEIVLITNDKGNVRFGQFRGTHGKYWIWKGNTLETVLAWMPLPKPWKGADDE